MHVAQQLEMLQNLDLELDRLKAQAAEIRAAVIEPPALSETREALRQIESQMDKARKACRDRDYEVRDGQARISELEARLYSDQVKPAKELANLQREVESLKVQQAVREERSLECLASLEQVQAAQTAAQGALSAAQQSWDDSQARSNSELSALDEAIAARQARRQAQASAIDGPSLAVYERLRPIKAGRAVARLAGNRCEGCRLILPSGDAVRAKTSPGLVFCVNCGRILCR